mmetsp:Transcript_31498/g.54602  ORF Transcript_31498/g.54602 Transcript_31498/m.54602 type:complete len:89 (-) Transcript_31498:737-1003(-)
MEDRPHYRAFIHNCLVRESMILQNTAVHYEPEPTESFVKWLLPLHLRKGFSFGLNQVLGMASLRHMKNVFGMREWLWFGIIQLAALLL